MTRPTRMPRRFLVVGVALLGLVAASCGDDTAGDVASSTPPSAAASEAPAAAPPATEGPATSLTSLTSLTPTVLCIDDVVYFGYVNESTEPVVIPEGSGNSLTGANPADQPLLPTLFAPGEVVPAFYAIPFDEQVVWTLVGPDGVSREAVASIDTTQPCTDDLVTGTSSDTRQAVLSVVSSETSGDASSATIDVSLTAVPALSVCNPAFTPLPASISLDFGNGDDLVEGTTATTTVDLASFDGGPPRASITVAAVVLDQCEFDGTVVSSWPANPSLIDAYQGQAYCAELVDGVAQITVGRCPGLPLTDGIRVRPK